MIRNNTDHLNYGRVIGEIPQSIIDKKYEKTDIYEDDDQLNNYYRNVLRDDGPDPVDTFAYGSKRSNAGYSQEEIDLAAKMGVSLPKTTASSGVMRSTILNIRATGQRSTIQPRHSEAFLELTGKDPRGHSNLPDMRKLVEHSRARADNYRLSFKNDDDFSVHESARNPSKVSSDKKTAMMAAKQKIQVFNESETTWASGNGMVKSKKTKSEVEKVLLDNDVLDIHDQPLDNRRSNVTLLSNTLPGGWSQEADHKVPIGRYSKVYSGYGKTVDIYKNRTAVDLDNRVVKSVENNYLPSSVISLMNKHIKSRKEYQDTLPPSSRYWGKSVESFNSSAPMKQESVQEKVRNGLIGESNNRKKTKSVEIENRPMNKLSANPLNRDSEVDVRLIKLLKKGIEVDNKTQKMENPDLIKIKTEILSTQKSSKSKETENKTMSNAIFAGHNTRDNVVYNKSGLKVEVFSYKNPMKVFRGGANVDDIEDDAEKSIMKDDENHIRKANITELSNMESFNAVDDNVFKEDHANLDKRRTFYNGKVKKDVHFEHEGTVYED